MSQKVIVEGRKLMAMINKMGEEDNIEFTLNEEKLEY